MVSRIRINIKSSDDVGFEPQTLDFKVNLHSQPKNKSYGTLKFDKTLLNTKSLTENESQGRIKWLIWTFLGTSL